MPQVEVKCSRNVRNVCHEMLSGTTWAEWGLNWVILGQTWVKIGSLGSPRSCNAGQVGHVGLWAGRSTFLAIWATGLFWASDLGHWPLNGYLGL